LASPCERGVQLVDLLRVGVALVLGQLGLLHAPAVVGLFVGRFLLQAHHQLFDQLLHLGQRVRGGVRGHGRQHGGLQRHGPGAQQVEHHFARAAGGQEGLLVRAQLLRDAQHAQRVA